jgi:hypothetical protein
MFNPENQFFPTPKAIAKKMIAPYITNHRLTAHTSTKIYFLSQTSQQGKVIYLIRSLS